MRRFAAAAMLACGMGLVHGAAPIYRCGSVYSQTPCPAGDRIDAADPRSADQRAQAKRAAAAQRKQASEMERDRRAEAKAQKPATASGFNGRPPPADSSASAPQAKSGKKSSKAKAAANPDFVALEQGPPRTGGK
jgi:hypothetical protein